MADTRMPQADQTYNHFTKVDPISFPLTASTFPSTETNQHVPGDLITSDPSVSDGVEAPSAPNKHTLH